ncbi:MAG TPA: helix-turn-helix domain-containing protein [Terracidiphilus sp.]|jgi:AcrR family transcriptional regulator|nr:helix-turn-helix domain-containing protein [Terracidiphilus sp.]
METLSKQELRIRETQARLLDAAEEVFVRDGYEAAQLDEIAARAERSKGAVYTHFRSKEDLFLALFEHRTRDYVERLLSILGQCKTREESIAAFRDFYVGLVADRTWPTLTLEFKLFALRHPESKERLRQAFAISRTTNHNPSFQQIFGKLSREEKAAADASLIALGPVVSGLILESHFEPKLLSEKNLRGLLGRLFDALVSPELLRSGAK